MKSLNENESVEIAAPSSEIPVIFDFRIS